MIWVAGFVAFYVGMLLGMGYAIACRDCFDVWIVTNKDGHTYVVTDPAEIEAALAVDGMLAVQRLRVQA